MFRMRPLATATKRGGSRARNSITRSFATLPLAPRFPGLGGRGGGRGDGGGGGGSCTATRNCDRCGVLGLERLSKRLETEFPRGSWRCEGLQLWEAAEKSPEKGPRLLLRASFPEEGWTQPPASVRGFRQGLYRKVQSNLFFNPTGQITPN